MKKTILGFAALLMVSASFAQPTPGKFNKGQRQEMHKGGRGEGFQKLNLTDAQEQQMKTLKEDFRKQMQDLNKKENITVKEQRDQRNELAKAHKQKIESILTTEQKSQLAQSKVAAKAKRAEMEAKHLDHLKEKLNLTDAQVSQIKANQQKTQSRFDALLNDDNLDGSDKRQQLMALREEMKKNMESVLTPDQKTKMEELRKERQDKGKSFRGHRGPADRAK